MTAVSHAPLRKVTLQAARSKAFPDGSIRHGYDFVAPLTEEGRIDFEAWKAHRGACFVHRFWGDEPAMQGLLVHHAGGRGGATWAFEWKTPPGAASDEDEGFRFGDHTFKVGEYVSIREPEGDLLTFRVTGVANP
ncbi:hypothetical protein DFR50_13450 [Roseiarcus fermentans]|uniref:Uncharacterized protein n=1 Tax=Roseiarcus fermentans TaxID=1473586 RepID=A0A366ETG1_9HYPH|nr:hypothetical protein [Roseiarcus fermentans]RBP05687.1 hypothetical protein DFR50_13450 [Roseiarcus fermentans]